MDNGNDFEEIKQLALKIAAGQLPDQLREKVQNMVARLERIARLGGNYAAEYDSISRYLDWVVGLPWNNRSQDILEIDQARQILDKNHYGLQSAKDKIREYLAVLKLNPQSRAPILLLVGLAGTGKTTLAKSIAQAMGRNFGRIPFGGIGDALFLRGQSRAYPDAEPGAVIKALRRAGTKNPVILLDEIDRVDDHARATIMGVLVELLDPEQNAAFTDHFIDFPFDLSEVLFVATVNNTNNISLAVTDRLEPIQMPSYSDAEKIAIGRDFILPKVLEAAGLNSSQLEISPDLWPGIVRPFGYDAGLRTLERTINSLVRKAALQIVSGQNQKIVVNEQSLQGFLAQ